MAGFEDIEEGEVDGVALCKIDGEPDSRAANNEPGEASVATD